jgi:hypothetical protein
VNQLVGGGIILKKDGWLVSVCWKTLDEPPIVSIRKNCRSFFNTDMNVPKANVAAPTED